jgi:hypothetical protein
MLQPWKDGGNAMQLSLIKGRKLGLEVWRVLVNGEVRGQFFSEAHARTLYLRLRQMHLGY